MPDIPFVIVDREGCHVDFTGIGELWDAQTVASVRWGLPNSGGVEYGRVTLMDGTKRNFTNRHLMMPYVKAHRRA